MCTHDDFSAAPLGGQAMGTRPVVTACESTYRTYLPYKTRPSCDNVVHCYIKVDFYYKENVVWYWLKLHILIKASQFKNENAYVDLTVHAILSRGLPALATRQELRPPESFHQSSVECFTHPSTRSWRTHISSLFIIYTVFFWNCAPPPQQYCIAPTTTVPVASITPCHCLHNQPT